MIRFGNNDIARELFGDTGDSGLGYMIDMERSERPKRAVDQLYRDLSPWIGGAIRLGAEKSEDGAGWVVVIEPTGHAGRSFLEPHTLSSLARRAMTSVNQDESGAPSRLIRFAYTGSPMFSSKGIIHFRTEQLPWLDSMGLTRLTWKG